MLQIEPPHLFLNVMRIQVRYLLVVSACQEASRFGFSSQTAQSPGPGQYLKHPPIRFLCDSAKLDTDYQQKCPPRPLLLLLLFKLYFQILNKQSMCLGETEGVTGCHHFQLFRAAQGTRTVETLQQKSSFGHRKPSSRLFQEESLSLFQKLSKRVFSLREEGSDHTSPVEV